MKTIKILMLLLAVLLVTGCFGGTTVPATYTYYALEYPSPPAESKASYDAVVRAERFTSAPEFIGRDMIFRSQPFVRDSYRYHRWTSAPADMVQGLLLRDLRQAGIFRAVLTPDDIGEARYVLYGHVEEFLQREEKNASLIVNLTLMDSKGPGDVLMQKTYRISEPLASRGPQEAAKGMSTAMARLSAAFLQDLHVLIQDRREKP